MRPAAPEGLVEAGEQPASAADTAEDLAALLAAANERELTLRGLLRSAHEQLARRDDEIARLTGRGTPWDTQRAERDAERIALRGEIDRLAALLAREHAERDEALAALRQECAELREIVDEDAVRTQRMLSTRTWRMARVWWALRDAFRER